VAFRWYLTAAGSLLVLNSTFASSAPCKSQSLVPDRRLITCHASAGIVPELEQQFGFGREVGTLTISLFVAGYVCGPLLWGPASEQVGRKPVFLVAFLFYTGFQVRSARLGEVLVAHSRILQVGCALSPDTAAILIFRFLGGVFASCPLTNSGYVIASVLESGY
jgi:MFS family permease